MIKKLIICIVSLAVFMALLFTVRPPGAPSRPAPSRQTLYSSESYLTAGRLPGITWVDDIHPIFVRNGCDACHTRGKETAVEGLTEFALGLIDPEAPSNPFYSYHELVYPEGPPQIQEGENLRDGQCCWPRGFSPDRQRRIWVGHAERSVLLRKLERDYYDWEKPPRFLEEGLRLLWGMPMPMYHKETEHPLREPDSMAQGKVEGYEHDREGAAHRDEKEKHAYEVRSFLKRSLFHLSLWLGINREKLHTLPTGIPEKDRTLLRYWITHALQLKERGTGMEIRVVDEKGVPVKDSLVHLIGNFNSPGRAKVTDLLDMRTDPQGEALLEFPPLSVVTSFWFVSAEVNGKSTERTSLRMIPGRINKVAITLSNEKKRFL